MTYAFQLYGCGGQWRRDVSAQNLSTAVNRYIDLLEQDGGITAMSHGDVYDLGLSIDGGPLKYLRVTVVFKPALRIDVMTDVAERGQQTIADLGVVLSD